MTIPILKIVAYAYVPVNRSRLRNPYLKYLSDISFGYWSRLIYLVIHNYYQTHIQIHELLGITKASMAFSGKFEIGVSGQNEAWGQ